MNAMIETLRVPANTDDDPYATVQSALDWLRLLRKESLKLDVAAMSPERRRQHDEAMRQGDEAIAYLLAKL